MNQKQKKKERSDGMKTGIWINSWHSYLYTTGQVIIGLYTQRSHTHKHKVLLLMLVVHYYKQGLILFNVYFVALCETMV